MRSRVSLTTPWSLFWWWSGIAPVSGEYTVDAVIDGVPRSVSTRVDATILLPRPATVDLVATSPTEVRASWPLVTGAVSYFVRLVEPSPFRTLHTWNTRDTSVTFPFLGLSTGVDHRVDVFPVNVDVTRWPQVTVPDRFNMSRRDSAIFRVTAAGALQIKDVRDADDPPPYEYFTRGR
jgi:hypothetical protein